MTTMDDAADIASRLPEVTDGERHGHRTWFVRGKAFAWQRPLSKADIKRLGDEPAPTGPILAVSVADLGEKEAVLASNTPGIFTIEHFNNYPAILIQLERVSRRALTEAILDGWLAAAPPKLADEYLAK